MALTKSVAAELAPHGIYVNAFAPGTIDTAIKYNDTNNAAMMESLNKIAACVPQRRRGTADDMVGPALFLATEESDYVNGVTFLADGGWAVTD